MFTQTLAIILLCFAADGVIQAIIEANIWAQSRLNSNSKTYTMQNAVIEGNFDLRELIHLTAAECDAQLSEVDYAVKTALKILKTEISKRGYATIEGFGSFRVDEIASRSGIDPQGNPFSVEERLTVEFNPEKRFRDELSKLTGKKVIA